MSKKPDIREFFIPTKQPVPSLRYDLALWCRRLMDFFPGDVSPFLHESDFVARLPAFYEQAERVKPESFPHRLRIYIFDHRLHPLFLAVDQDGQLATTLDDYAHYRHCWEDAVYGASDMFEDSNSADWIHKPSVRAFAAKYDIIPIEMFGAPTLVIFEGDHLSDFRRLSIFEAVRVIQQFQSENLIDWSQHRLIEPLK